MHRAAVRGLERAGVSRSAAMTMTGYTTEAVQRRCAIVTEVDLRDAAATLGAVVPRLGTIAHTVTGRNVVELPRVSQK